MKKFLIIFSATLALTACAPNYNNYYALDANYMARRQMETKRFETKDEDSILTASAAVLQDLGFTLEESETKLGLITATKSRETGPGTAGRIGIVLLAGLTGSNPVYDTQQKVFTTLVTNKSRTADGYNVRVDFTRIVWDNNGASRIEQIQDPGIYQQFFDKLSQSLFLTANDL